MKRTFCFGLGLALLSSPAVFALSTADPASDPSPAPATTQRVAMRNPSYNEPAFSRMSFGAGISPLGIGLQVSTNLNQHLNLRGVGNVFKYSTSFTTSGIPASASLNLSSGGAMVDYYPFHAGFRLSGGALFLNQNQLSATASITEGNSITLNGQTYYSANANAVTGATPLSGTGGLALNTTKPSAVVTTGWGNHVGRSGHWSFPFELGAAFVGAPKTTVNIGGWACLDQAQTMCTNIGDPNNPIAQQFQSNLNAQVSKWNSDISALKTYPIVSFGVAYNFQVRRNVR